MPTSLARSHCVRPSPLVTILLSLVCANVYVYVSLVTRSVQFFPVFGFIFNRIKIFGLVFCLSNGYSLDIMFSSNFTARSVQSQLHAVQQEKKRIVNTTNSKTIEKKVNTQTKMMLLSANYSYQSHDKCDIYFRVRTNDRKRTQKSNQKKIKIKNDKKS